MDGTVLWAFATYVISINSLKRGLPDLENSQLNINFT